MDDWLSELDVGDEELRRDQGHYGEDEDEEEVDPPPRLSRATML